MRTVYLMGTRPTTTPDGKVIPVDAVIVTAQRPIWSSQARSDGSPELPMWIDGVNGPCYATIDHDDEDALRDAEDNGAWIAEWVSREEMIYVVVSYMPQIGVGYQYSEALDGEIITFYQRIRNEGERL